VSALGLYLDALFGAEPVGGYIEVRFKASTGMGQRWFSCEDRSGASRFIRAQGQRSDTYVGVAPRREQRGSAEVVERVHALYVDVDTEEAMSSLRRFSPTPSIVVRSGSGLHAYWPILPPLGAAETRAANRRLARALGADMAATDAARILRPPETFNHKTGSPVPVEVARLEPVIFEAQDVVGALPEEAERDRERRSEGTLLDPSDALATIPPTVYVEVLTGREVGSDGKATCPFHAGGQERTPSLHAYPTPEAGWVCFAGCGGGSIIDLGALLYRIEPRGRGFTDIRKRLAKDLLAASTAVAV